jgi:hypothetical protein
MYQLGPSSVSVVEASTLAMNSKCTNKQNFNAIADHVYLL